MTEKKKSSLTYKGKAAIVKTSLIALATTFEIVSQGNKEMRDEIAEWESGRSFSIGVLPDGPAVWIKKDGPYLRYMGQGHGNAKLRVLFKNIDSAVLLMTGQMASHRAFAEHRAIVHGSISQAVEANRVMAIAQKFLFPGLILKRNFKRPPRMNMEELALKAKVMATLSPKLMLNLTK